LLYCALIRDVLGAKWEQQLEPRKIDSGGTTPDANSLCLLLNFADSDAPRPPRFDAGRARAAEVFDVRALTANLLDELAEAGERPHARR
jgi:hypothetical protein